MLHTRTVFDFRLRLRFQAETDCDRDDQSSVTTFRGFSRGRGCVPSIIDAPGHMLAAETMSRRVSNAPVSLDVSGDVGIIAMSNPPVNALAIPGAHPDRPALLFPRNGDLSPLTLILSARTRATC